MNEFIERLASKLPFEPPTTMYDGSYKYTTSKFRQALLDIITKYQQSSNNASTV